MFLVLENELSESGFARTAVASKGLSIAATTAQAISKSNMFAAQIVDVGKEDGCDETTAAVGESAT